MCVFVNYPIPAIAQKLGTPILAYMYIFRGYRFFILFIPKNSFSVLIISKPLLINSLAKKRFRKLSVSLSIRYRAENRCKALCYAFDRWWMCSFIFTLVRAIAPTQSRYQDICNLKFLAVRAAQCLFQFVPAWQTNLLYCV